MRIKLLLLLFILIWGLSPNSLRAQGASDIVVGKKITIRSSVLNEDRELLISLPDSYSDNNYTRYPVLYLLDGQKFFRSFSGVVKQLSSDASPQVPEMIVVGITSQQRVRDSSPTHSLNGYSGREEKGYEVSGGADNFLAFIKTELITFIDANYRTNSYRTFVGYSFTGLPVLHSLFEYPEIFNSYLVIDFSAWWDSEVTLKNMKMFFREYSGSAKKDVFIATENRVYNVVYPESTNPTWRFIQAFRKQRPVSISFGYKRYGYKEENHHSMPLVSFIDGLKYIFRGYMINYDEMYTKPVRIKLRFSKLSERLGYKVCPREDLINFFGYQFLYAHPDLEKSLFYFSYNTENFPLSSSAWRGLAEAYQVKGDKTKAVSYYQKALEIDPSDTTSERKLEELERLP
jgi:predicted alpha/beta superfamily hydrolase